MSYSQPLIDADPTMRSLEPENSQAPDVKAAIILTLGICGVFFLPCSLIAWVMGNRAMRILNQYRANDSDQRNLVIAGRILGIVATAYHTLFAIYLTAMIVQMVSMFSALQSMPR